MWSVPYWVSSLLWEPCEAVNLWRLNFRRQPRNTCAPFQSSVVWWGGCVGVCVCNAPILNAPVIAEQSIKRKPLLIYFFQHPLSPSGMLLEIEIQFLFQFTAGKDNCAIAVHSSMTNGQRTTFLRASRASSQTQKIADKHPLTPQSLFSSLHLNHVFSASASCQHSWSDSLRI